MSDSIKPIHFKKVIDEYFPLKQTVSKYFQVEKNDVISKMADLPNFDLKIQISREQFIQS